MKELVLTDLIDVGILQQIQDGFSDFTGMAALTADAQGVAVTEGSRFTDFCMELTRKSPLGCKRCEQCDKNGALETLRTKQVSIYDCHAGLVDFAAPIMVEGKFIGSFIGGQVRTHELDEEKMKAIAAELKIDENIYLEALKQVRILDRKVVEKTAAFLAEIAKILSEMAYRNYTAIENSRKMERAARSQTAYIMKMGLNMEKSMSGWNESIGRALESGNPSEMYRTLKALRGQSMGLLCTVEDTIEYVRMSDGKVELMEGEYEIRDLIDQMVGSARAQVDGEKVVIEAHIEQNVPRVLMGDSGRIGQIVYKLLQNSLQFTKQGWVKVFVSSEKISYSTWITIEIRDNGVGMTKEQLESSRASLNKKNVDIFDDEGMIEKGFSVLGVLVRKMAGTIDVQSEPEKGTSCVLRLPQLEAGGEGNGI